MTKRLFFFAAFVILAASLFLSPAFAAYSWVDENGEFHITDYPRPVKREEPKASTPEKPAPPTTPQVKQSPVQSPAPTPVPTTPAAASVSSSSGTPTVRSLTPVTAGTLTARPNLPATAGTPSSAGTLTIRPASPVSQLTPTTGGQTSMVTATTVSQVTTTALPAVPQQPQVALPGPQQMAVAGMVAFVLAFFTVFLVLLAIMYVYFSLCLYLIAKKLNVPSPWIAWVPIANIWTLLQSAGKPCWWVLLFFIPFVSIIVVAYVWMCIVENLGRNKWLGLLMLVPVINLIYIGVLAFSKQEHLDDPHDHSDEMIGQEWTPTQDSSEEHE